MSLERKAKSISILGCGWYGFAVGRALVEKDYLVKGSCTSTDKFEILQQAGINPFKVIIDESEAFYTPDFFNCDILIIAIPPKRRSGEVASYPEKIRTIKDAILAQGVKRILFISSTSVYGDQNCEVTEETVPVPDTESGKAILEAENLLQNEASISATILRFGGMIGPERNPARFFSGKKEIPNGKAPVNLIHLDDCIEVTLEIIKQDAFGHVFNACASIHPSKNDFYTQAAMRSNLELPEFKDELNRWKIVSSNNLKPVLGLSLTHL